MPGFLKSCLELKNHKNQTISFHIFIKPEHLKNLERANLLFISIPQKVYCRIA